MALEMWPALEYSDAASLFTVCPTFMDDSQLDLDLFFVQEKNPDLKLDLKGATQPCHVHQVKREQRKPHRAAPQLTDP
jgi:hypothetical protein